MERREESRVRNANMEVQRNCRYQRMENKMDGSKKSQVPSASAHSTRTVSQIK